MNEHPIAQAIGKFLRLFGSTKDPESILWSRIGGPLTGTAVQSLLIGTPLYFLAKRFMDEDKARKLALMSTVGPAALNAPLFAAAFSARAKSKGSESPMSFWEALNYSPHELVRDVQANRWPALTQYIQNLARQRAINVLKGDVISTLAKFSR